MADLLWSYQANGESNMTKSLVLLLFNLVDKITFNLLLSIWIILFLLFSFLHFC